MDVDKEPLCCVPGDCICAADEKKIAGTGTYIRHGHIFSSLAGFVEISRQDNSKQEVVRVHRGRLAIKRVPRVGSLVTCKILSMSLMNAKCSIHCIEHHVLRQTFRGLIRKEDVRVLDKDRIEIYKCFRPGDIVLARVVGVGENNAFLLSTAEDELGVTIAYSEENKETPMVPIKWTEMACMKTGARELRKVAKIHSNKNFKDLKNVSTEDAN